MASNIQRGTRKIDAGDWIRLKRLGGAKNYLTDQPQDITNPPPTCDDVCGAIQYNGMSRAEFGTSKFRRPASYYTDYKASQSADYVLEYPREFGGKILSAVKLCNCSTTDPNKHNPLCASCMHDKIEVRNKTANFYVQGQFYYTAGVYTPGGDYTGIINYLANLYNVSPSDVKLEVKGGSIQITYQISAFTTEKPNEVKIQQAVANIIQNYPNATGLNFVGGDISGYYTLTQNGVTSPPVTLFSPTYSIKIFAGQPGNPGYVDGIGSIAKFGQITSIAVDAGNNTYVWDAANFCIRKITEFGVVSTFTDLGFTPIISPGLPPAQRFIDIAIGRNSYVMYAIESGGNVIYTVNRDGVYSVAFGDVTTYGSVNGPPNMATFQDLSGICVDYLGNIYVSQRQNSQIRKINMPSGQVDIYVNVPGSSPTQLTVDNNLDLYFIDNNKICKINNNRIVTVFAGSGTFGSVDGTGLNAQFDYLFGITYDSNNNLYVSESANNVIRKITNTGIVTTFAGDGTSGFTIGATALASKFNYPFGIVFNNYGDALICDRNNYTIRRIRFGVPYQTTITIGSGFNLPSGVAVDSVGNVYVTEPTINAVKKITPQGAITTIGGGFSGPYGVAVDPVGNVYVTELTINAVKKITPQGAITTIGGGFSGPSGVAVDPVGNVYVGDTYNNAIKKVTPQGNITTIGGGFFRPYEVAVDSVGNVYVADTYNNAVRKVTPQGAITTIGSGFSAPFGVAVDSVGDVYVADHYNSAVKKILF